MRRRGERGRARWGFILAVGIAVLLVAAVGAAASDGGGGDGHDGQEAGEHSHAVHHDTSLPLRSLAPAAAPTGRQEREDHPLPRPPVVPVPDGALQSAPGAAEAPALGVGFEGVGQGFSGPSGTFSVTSAPPDPNGAVGPNNYVQIVNTSFAVFDKSGAALYGPVPTNTLWSGFGGGCQANNDGDATVVYDQLADRWIVTQFSVSTTPYLECVAVSTTSDPTGSYYRYAFQYANFPDYPKLSVWPDAYYISFNLFQSSTGPYVGPEVCGYDRAKMLSGQTATQQCFTLGTSFGGLLPSTLDGSTPPPVGSPNYVLDFGTNSLEMWKFHIDWTTPANSSLTGLTSIPVAPFTPVCPNGPCIPQPGTTQQLDALGDRLMYRLVYRNFGDHESLVVDHSVTAGSSSGVRWYELRNPRGTPTVYQQGTYAPDASSRWMGSVAMDRNGGIGLGFSISSSTIKPGIHYTGRVPGDPLGTMGQGEGVLLNGTGSQLPTLNRWGDYSSINIDPSDDCTFWYTNEYLTTNGTFNWHTRIGTFKLPGCGASDYTLSASPASQTVLQGQSSSYTVTVTPSGGFTGSVNLSVAGLPTGATATFAPNPTTATSTMSVATAATTPAGSYLLTITGTSGTLTHTTQTTLVVTQPDFSLSATPASLTVAQGGSGTTTIATTVTTAPAQTINLSASGQPAGATVSFNPASLTAGASSTMTVAVASSTVPGTYAITVTATGTSATHTTTVTLTVPAPGGAGVVNGGFETGSLSGWTSSGFPPKVVTTSPHTGAYDAQIGSTAAFNGDSILSQTVAIPAGNSRLTFWYQPHCTDTITYDQIQMQIRNTAGAMLANVLNVCSNSGAWTQVSYDTSAYAGQTVVLWFNNHDDGYPGDPTYFLLDDVAVNNYTPTTNVVQNPGFETGTLAPWATSGAFLPFVSSTAHSGTRSAQIGSSGPVNGNSTLTQTVAVPTGNPTLTFWYQPHCTDSIIYDQIQMQIRNTAGAILATVLNVCSNSGAWTQVNFGLTPYAGQTIVLWFNNHDDGYPGDPTYFLLDDVTVR